MSTQKAIDLSQTILKCPTPSDIIMDITHYITLVFSAQESLYKAFSSIGIILSYEDIFCIGINKEKTCTLHVDNPINKVFEVHFYFSKYYNLVIN